MLNTSKSKRAKILGHQPAVFWFTGLSGAGKSTLANILEHLLIDKGIHAFVLDGDKLRDKLNTDLDFSDYGRSENIRRASEISRLFLEAGCVVISSFISPLAEHRTKAREICTGFDFFEVFIECPLEECANRDTKGLYKKAMAGEIANFTGLTSTYEIPLAPDLVIHTKLENVEDSVKRLMEFVLLKLNYEK